MIRFTINSATAFNQMQGTTAAPSLKKMKSPSMAFGKQIFPESSRNAPPWQFPPSMSSSVLFNRFDRNESLMQESLSLSVPLPVRKMVEALKQAPSFMERIQLLEDASQNPESSGFKRLDDNLYDCQGYRFKLGFRMMMDTIGDQHRYLSGKGIKAAPELVTYQPINDSDAVLILRYPGTETQDLLSYEPLKNTVSTAAKKLFWDEMNQLAQDGVMHPYAGRGFYNWKLNPTSGTIHLTQWEAIQPMFGPEISESLEKIKGLLDIQ
ncbi:MAG: hypothetical protein K2X66_13055 [Cyanobacteria bacterium]|nr:hypothetical protein [Cyanobacteriota bacterium]